MNASETGRFIAKLRKEAGFTQKSLADALHITDKAVSKWERGLGLPDSSLLPSIAKLLDCDIDILISGFFEYRNHQWTGLLVLNESEMKPSANIYNKPLVFYLLSYFLLVGITDVEIRASAEDRDYIKSLHLEQYGMNISFTHISNGKKMIVFESVLLFGANLTRYFQSFMASNDNIIPVLDGMEVPIVFSHGNTDKKVLHKIAVRRKMGRGIVKIPMNSAESTEDASEFVRIYSEYHGLEIADLKEIAEKRGLIK